MDVKSPSPAGDGLFTFPAPATPHPGKAALRALPGYPAASPQKRRGKRKQEGGMNNVEASSRPLAAIRVEGNLIHRRV